MKPIFEPKYNLGILIRQTTAGYEAIIGLFTEGKLAFDFQWRRGAQFISAEEAYEEGKWALKEYRKHFKDYEPVYEIP